MQQCRAPWWWIRAFACASLLAAADAVAVDDYTEMSLRDLLALDVFTSASLLPTETSKAPATVYGFETEDFVRFGARRLEDLLQYVPGLQMNQYRKRHKAVWSRGLLDRYNDKMVLIVDGIRQQHLYYGHFALGDNLPLERIERVEIILSPASSLYGANAFGGIISVTTKGFATASSVDLTAEVADNSRIKATGFYNSERLQAFASAVDQDAPYREDRKSFIGSDVLQPLGEDYQSVFLRGRPLDALTLAIDYNASETPFLFIPPTQNAFIDARTLTFSAHYADGDVGDGRIEGNLYYTDDETREYELEQITQQPGYVENQDATLAGGVLRWLRRFGSHTVALGGTWEYERAEDTSFIRYFHFDDGFLPEPRTGDLLSTPGITNNNYAFFAQDVWSINEQLDLTLNARYDSFDQFGDDWNYRAAAVYAPTSAQTWKLMYGTAIRAPTLREYLKVLESDFVPPPLAPEEIQSAELGFAYRWEQAALNVNLFHNHLDNFILEQPTPDGQDEFFANLPGEWKSTGVEMLLDTRPTERTTLRVGLSHIDLERTDGEPVPYVADWTGNLHGSYRVTDEATIGLAVFYNSDRPDTNDFPDSEPGSFVVTNLMLNGRFSDR